MYKFALLGLLFSTQAMTPEGEESSSPPVVEEQKIPNESADTHVYIISVKKGADLDTVMEEMVQKTGGRIVHVYASISGFAIEVPAAFNEKNLRYSPDIEEVEPDLEFKPLEETSSQATQLITNGGLRIGLNLSPTAKIDGIEEPLNVNIAIIDTGVDLTHPDLNVVFSKSFINGSSSGTDENGHGTHVAGIAAAKDNGIGMAGVAPGARIYALKALDSTGSGYLSDVVKALDWVVERSKTTLTVTNSKKYSKAIKDYETHQAKSTQYWQKYQGALSKYQQTQKKSDWKKADEYRKKAVDYQVRAGADLEKAGRYSQSQLNPDKIDVVNMSLGARGTSSTLLKVIQAAVDKGVIVIAAAGNKHIEISGPDLVYGTADDFIPAAYAEVAAISAMGDFDGISGGLGPKGSFDTEDDTLAGFSNFSSVIKNYPIQSIGRGIDSAAPGVDIYSTWLQGTYRYISGTSMAAPHVAGAAVLLIAKLGQDINKDGKIDAKDVVALRQMIINTGFTRSSWRNGKTALDPDAYYEPLLNVSNY